MKRIVGEYIDTGKLNKNINSLYQIGSILGISIIIQIITGIILTNWYTTKNPYKIVEEIMRESSSIIREIHRNGSIIIFILVYIHLFRNLYYNSYIKLITYHLGLLIFILLILISFLGYTLPDGQMSYWGGTVITNLISIFPLVGPSLRFNLIGDYSISPITLSRFYTLHYILPFSLLVLILLHLYYLHIYTGTNPLGLRIKGITFKPYYTRKDLIGIISYLFLFLYILSYLPTYLLESDNSIKSNPLITPSHIEPELYLLPFYTILRSIPNKTLGLLFMLLSISVLFLLPYYQSSLSINLLNRSNYQSIILHLSLIFLLLGYLGKYTVVLPYNLLNTYIVLSYFFLFILIPLSSSFESLFFFL